MSAQKYLRFSAISLAVFTVLFISHSVNAYNLQGHKFTSHTFHYYDGTLSDFYDESSDVAMDNWWDTPTQIGFTPTSDVNSADINITGAYYGNNGTTASTLIWKQNGIASKAEIRANYSEMDGIEDFKKAATFTHELGHVFGIDHVSSKSQIMYGYLTGRTVYTPQSDDINGVNFLYP
ncbi:matrixin family metalloprotease [Paenibacillus sp. P36]|uniref:matrixin family metalloprotease n=1 Tax=Paenibacillus sp. P36 TaxID=3342538 RepID=UPI0038B2D86C